MLRSVDGKTTVAWVPQEQLPAAFAAFSAQLARGAEMAGVSREALTQEFAAGEAFLGVAYGEAPFQPLGVWAAAVREDYVDIFALAGREAKRWLGPGLELVREWARLNGLDRIRAIGRRAWLRRLPEFHEIGIHGSGQLALEIEV